MFIEAVKDPDSLKLWLHHCKMHHLYLHFVDPHRGISLHVTFEIVFDLPLITLDPQKELLLVSFHL